MNIKKVRIPWNKGKPWPQSVKDKISKNHARPMLGKKFTKDHREKMSSQKIGKRNSNWKGDKVGYGALHIWVNKHKPRPKLCENCDSVPPIDCANVSGEYKRDINDFKWLCRKCHMVEDGRLNKFALMNSK